MANLNHGRQIGRLGGRYQRQAILQYRENWAVCSRVVWRGLWCVDNKTLFITAIGLFR